MSNRANPPEPKWYQSRNFNYLLASMLIPTGLVTGYLFRNQLDNWLGQDTPKSGEQPSLVQTDQQNGDGNESPSPTAPSTVSNWQQGMARAQQASVLAQDAALSEEWAVVASQWQSAIESLQQVNPKEDNYDEAQSKIEQYQQNLAYAQQNITNPPLWIKAIAYANQANQFVATANTIDDWKQVASQWKKAIDLLGAIPEGDPNYAQAQQKITEYENNFSYALDQIPDEDAQSFTPTDNFQEAVNQSMAAANQV